MKINEEHHNFRPSGATTAMPHSKNPILIVDDQVGMRNLLENQILSFGYQCITATDGLDALQKLRQDSFSTVITDMVMPIMNGMELLVQIRQELPHIDVIVITGHDDAFNYTEVIEAGATDYLKKPYRINELEAKLKRVAREQNMIRELRAIQTGLEEQLQERNFSLEELQDQVHTYLDRIRELQSQMIVTKYGQRRGQKYPYYGMPSPAVALPEDKKKNEDEE